MNEEYHRAQYKVNFKSITSTQEKTSTETRGKDLKCYAKQIHTNKYKRNIVDVKSILANPLFKLVYLHTQDVCVY